MRWLTTYLWALAVCLLTAASVRADHNALEIRIGTHTYQQREQMIAQYQPLMQAITRQMPGYRVRLVPYDHAALEQAIDNGQIDFALLTPSHYLYLAKRHGLPEALATMVPHEHGQELFVYGGTIITRSDRVEINRLQDLQGKKIAAMTTGPGAFASYQVQAYELHLAGLPLPDTRTMLITGPPQKKVVDAVLDGSADVGFVRTGLLESLVRQGALDPARVKVINRQPLAGYPYQASTRLYPQWALVRLNHTDPHLASRFAAVLLGFQHGDPALVAAGVHGFTIPENYRAIDRLLKELKLPPYDEQPAFTVSDVFRRWKWQLAGALVVVLLVVWLVIKTLLTNRRLVLAKEKIRQHLQELEEARLAAEAANQAKTSFLINMSHEIRTPMNGVIGSAQLLKMTPLNYEQAEYLRSIELSGEGLLAIINDLLDLSKIESGELVLENRLFSLRASIEALAQSMQPLAAAKGLELNIRLPEGLPDPLKGDPFRLRQILVNLVGNAIKFTEAGSITIEARLVSFDNSVALLAIEVRDTGIGISADLHEKIFEPFLQADVSTTRRFGGTGLGLSICRKLAGIMGGSVTLESEPDAGSCFTLYCPLQLPEPGERFETPPHEQIEVGQLELAPLSILMAEDQLVNVAVIKGILGKLGHQLTIADDGVKALQLWRAGRFDLILMDVHMPVMDGCAALAEIRKEEQAQGRHTPIIALTAHAMGGDREQLLARGFDGYVSKPVDFGELLTEMRNVVRRFQSELITAKRTNPAP